MKKQVFLIITSIFLINNIVYSQGIYIAPPIVKAGSYKKIVIDTFGVFNPNNKFVLKIKSSITFSNDSLPNSPRYTNEFVNESYFECTSNLSFCYQAPYPKTFPIKGDKRTIWKDTTTYEVYSTSPRRVTNLLPIISSSGDSLSYCFIPFGCTRDTVDIDTLSENLNLANYIVPREATVHHYFKVEDTKNKPAKGVIVRYKIGDTQTTQESLPSDSLGLIDLAIKVGGPNSDISFDDIIPAGISKTISFYNILTEAGNARIDTNNFKPFSISVIDKALPTEKEFGLVYGIGAGISFGRASFNFAGVKLEAGFAKCGVGVSYRPTIIIQPKIGQENIWKAKIASEYGIKANIGVGPMFKAGVEHIAVGGVEGTILNQNIGYKFASESSYILNSLIPRDRLYLVSELIKISPFPDVKALLLSNFLKRLINNIDLSTSEKTTHRINFGIGNNNIGVKIDFGGTRDLTEDTEETPLGFGFGIFNDRNYNVESSEELDNIEGLTSAIKVTAKESFNIGRSMGGNFSNLFNDGTQIAFKFINEEKNHSITVSRNFSKFNKILQYGTAEFSTEKEIELNNISYQLTNNNKFYFSKKAIQNNIYNPYNFVSQYFNKGTFRSKNISFSPISLDANNAFHSIGRFQKEFLENEKKIYGKDDNYLESSREITKISERNYFFEVGVFVDVDFSIGYTSWNKYKHSYRTFQFSKDFNRLLKVVDYPDIQTNLELPDEDPFINFFSTISPMISEFPSDVVINAKNFVVERVESLANNILVFSNLTGNNLVERKYLNGEKFNSTNKNIQNTNTPSVFTFTIPSGNQSFNTGTNLLFKYYYPENQINAVTVSDTFKLITDAFFLNAKANDIGIYTAPNGNFTINTQFSNYELQLAGLPNNLSPKVLFLPKGSQTWQVLGPANQQINFNKLGVFSIGVALPKDSISPSITVIPPTSFVNGQTFSVSLDDNSSGIDWSKTFFICNGKVIPYQRIGTSNLFNIDIALLHSNPIQLPEVFGIEIKTSDLAGNLKTFSKVYPCTRTIKFLNILEGISSTPNKQQASQTIEISGSAATKPPLEIKAGKNIILNPGFEVKPISGEYFKANIGGCN